MHMREDNNNAEIRHREVSNYHLEQLDRVKEEFEKYEKFTDKEIQEAIDKSYEQSLKDQKDGLKRFEEGKQRYLDMLEKVENWEVPTEEHNNLKKFAIEQLESSLDFDYSDSMKKYYLQEPVKDNIEGYKKYKIKAYLKDIEYHSKGYREEIEGVEKNNIWIDNLIDSFN